MKIILIGASGTLGQAIGRQLGPRHQIVAAGRAGADVQVDIKDPASVRRMYVQVGVFDAVVCAAGNVHFGTLGEMTPEQFSIGLKDKLMGQVNLVTEGQHRIADGGSFTLISGILSQDPIRGGSSAAMVNAALDAFVAAAAIDLPRGIRINSVSPTVFVESMAVYGPYFSGFKPVPVDDAALAFAKSVEGAQTGRTYQVV
ncbi:short chain dehydrogenase [Cupriavidus sp. CuC1]|uniref:short chain dehydrogenase n=1 Tax=Cupriavidus sp. CuC1 TaxID=3373131 RepID=UPI0037D87759